MTIASITLRPRGRAQALEMCCAALIALDSARARLGVRGTRRELLALDRSVMTLREVIAELRRDAGGDLAGGGIGVVVAEDARPPIGGR